MIKQKISNFIIKRRLKREYTSLYNKLNKDYYYVTDPGMFIRKVAHPEGGAAIYTGWGIIKNGQKVNNMGFILD